MIALVDDLEANIAAVMKRASYQLPARFNANLVHRRFLCYPTASYRTHHLHLVDEREELDRCLRFRDTLRGDPKLATEYAALKRALAARFREDREGYTKAKSRVYQRRRLTGRGLRPVRFVMSGRQRDRTRPRRRQAGGIGAREGRLNSRCAQRGSRWPQP